MEDNRYKKTYSCSFEFAMDAISGKWKGLVLWNLHQNRVLRYGELRKLLGEITQKILTQTLRELENSSIIDRKVYPVVPPKVEYRLTSYGEKLIPILLQLHEWGEETFEVLNPNER